MSITTKNNNIVPTDWLDLVSELYDLRPIKTDETHNKAVEALRLVMRITKPNVDQQDYKTSLVDVIQKYEHEVYPLPNLEGDAIDNLQFLVEENGLSGSDIGRILGDRTLGSKILNRQRSLSKANIKKLCKHFKVRSELFM